MPVYAGHLPMADSRAPCGLRLLLLPIAVVLDSHKTFDSAEYGEDNFNFATYVSRSNAEKASGFRGLRLLTSGSALDPAGTPPPDPRYSLMPRVRHRPTSLNSLIRLCLQPHQMHRSLGMHRSQHPKRHDDRCSHFCRAHGRDRQTDRRTDHATQSVAIGRI